jgi:hypothetical protein
MSQVFHFTLYSTWMGWGTKNRPTAVARFAPCHLDDFVNHGALRMGKRITLTARCRADDGYAQPARMIARKTLEHEELALMGLTSKSESIQGDQ